MRALDIKNKEKFTGARREGESVEKTKSRVRIVDAKRERNMVELFSDQLRREVVTGGGDMAARVDRVYPFEEGSKWWRCMQCGQ